MMATMRTALGPVPRGDLVAPRPRYSPGDSRAAGRLSSLTAAPAPVHRDRLAPLLARAVLMRNGGRARSASAPPKLARPVPALDSVLALYRARYPEEMEQAPDVETLLEYSGRKTGRALIDAVAQTLSMFIDAGPPDELLALLAESKQPLQARPPLPPAIADEHVFDQPDELIALGFEPVGYRGTTTALLAKIRRDGFVMAAGSRGVNAAQRGEGVYTGVEIDTARDYAKGSAKKLGGEPVVLQLYAQKAWLVGVHKPMSAYGWGQKKAENIAHWDTIYDYVYGDIYSRHDQGDETKFSSATSQRLKAVIVER